MIEEDSSRKRRLKGQHEAGTDLKRPKVLEEGSFDDALLGELESLYQDIDNHIEPAIEQANIPKRNRHQPYKNVPIPRYGNMSLAQGTLDFGGRISKERSTDEQIIPQAREAPYGYVAPLPVQTAPTALVTPSQNTAKLPVVMGPISPISDDKNERRVPLQFSDTLPAPSFSLKGTQRMQAPIVKQSYNRSHMNMNDMQKQQAMHAQLQQQKQQQMAMMKQMQMRQYYQQIMQAQMMQNPAYQAQMMQNPAYQAQMQQYYRQMAARKQAQEASMPQQSEEETLTLPASMNMGMLQ